MKIRVASQENPPPKSKRGRKKTIGGRRLSFFPGDHFFDSFGKTRALFKQNNIKFPTQSFVLRQGGLMYLAKLAADLKTAQKGGLHGKQRNN